MRVYVCPDGQWDEVGQTCLAPGWAEQPTSILAGMTVEQAGEIAGAILTLLAIAFVLRLVIRWAEREA